MVEENHDDIVKEVSENFRRDLIKIMGNQDREEIAMPVSQTSGNTRKDYMTDAQIKHMVERFLAWRLPEDFNPDGGVSFEKEFNKNSQFGPMKNEPTGTNLLDYTQATAMVRHILEGLPDA